VGVDEKTPSTNVKDGPQMGGGGMSLSPPIQDMALEAPKGGVVDTRTAGGLQNTEGENFDLQGLHGLFFRGENGGYSNNGTVWRK